MESLLLFSIFASIPLLVSSQPISFTYDDFSNVPRNELLQSGRATITDGQLRLSDNNVSSYGRVMRTQPINFCTGNTPLSFTTDFTFTIRSRDGVPGVQNADGLAFIISPSVQSPSPRSFGRWMALLEPETNGLASNHMVAVEFDTYPNTPPSYPEFQDVDGNHVGINLNQVISANASSLTPYDIRLGSGNVLAARIVYTASVQIIRVYVSKDPSFKTLGGPVLEYGVNLCAYVDNTSYVGFSAGTGGGNVDFHDIHSWSFTGQLTTTPSKDEKGSSPEEGLTSNQAQSSFRTPFIALASVAGVFLLAVVLLFVYCFSSDTRMHRRYDVGKASASSLVLLPHEIQYGEILHATQGFRAENKLGQGGFGSVYRGVLPEDQSMVAVKRISENSTQGEREFLAEVKIISKLSHRNLVKLRGWCTQGKELVLVYEYMPQGSVDQALFKNDSAVLLWHTRYKIITGLASALIYLHEEWERQVLHRDIKCSNVMLDADYNARLGDFGLARVVEHSNKTRTSTLTSVAGTLGYMAPEIGYSFKFTTASDVYSFGVVVLEIVCGKKVVSFDEDGVTLIPWVEERYATGMMLSAVDPRLHGVFDPDEVTQVMRTGLLCVKRDPAERPSMRQAFHSLVGSESNSGS